jgi:hypothetical protein
MIQRLKVPRGLYLASLHSETLGPVAVAVDTSGSIDDATLAALSAEVTAIMDEAAPRSGRCSTGSPDPTSSRCAPSTSPISMR